MPLILPHHGKSPVIPASVWLAENATVIGEVTLGNDSSVWFGTVVRGDVNSIRIGARSNVQDLTMCHVSYQRSGLVIGDDVTIGHNCVLHACTIGHRVLVGMGSVVMDDVHLEDDVIVGAGSLVTEGTRIPAGHLALGRPAKVIKPLNDAQKKFLLWSSKHYMNLAASYRGGPWPYPGERAPM